MFFSLLVIFSYISLDAKNKENTFFTTKRVGTVFASSALGFIVCFLCCKKSVTLLDDADLTVNNSDLNRVNITLFDNSKITFNECNLKNMHIDDQRGEGIQGNTVIGAKFVNGTVKAGGKSTITI